MKQPFSDHRSHRSFRPSVEVDLAREPSPYPSRRGRARERRQQRQQRHTFRFSVWTCGILVVAIGGLIVIISLLSTRAHSAAPMSPARPFLANQPAALSAGAAIQPWTENRRLTVLLLGLDRRADWIDTGRSDSIMLLSIDPKTRSIGMLSIPRDLFVAFPNQPGLHRINTAYVEGELQKLGGGPDMTRQTIEYNFGIPIDHYVTVQFDAVINLIDAIGGIDIDVPVPIDDPEYPDMHYGYDPLHIPAGVTHMDGQLALKYARTRHQTNDYDRADRQQQVLLGIRQKLLQPGTLVQLLPQAPSIWNRLNQWVKTDMVLDQMLGIGWYAKDIPSANIHRQTVQGTSLIAIQYNGEGVVTLNRTSIGQLMAQVFGPDYGQQR